MSIEGQYIYRDEQDSVTVRDRSTLELANSTIGGKLIYSVRRLKPTDCRIWKEGLEGHGISTHPNSFPGLNTFTFSSSNGCYVTRLVYVGSNSVFRPFPVYSHDDFRQHFSFETAHSSPRDHIVSS
jgi:hypothetical protein